MWGKKNAPDDETIGIQEKKRREREINPTEEVIDGKENRTVRESIGIKVGGGK